MMFFRPKHSFEKHKHLTITLRLSQRQTATDETIYQRVTLMNSAKIILSVFKKNAGADSFE